MTNIGIKDDLLAQLSQDHSAQQQMWLSGYLYALAIQGGGVAATVVSPAAPNGISNGAGLPVAPKVTILFGSQTGNAEKSAHAAAALLRDRQLHVKVHDLNDYATRQLKDEEIVLLFVSTQGEGEPPVSAEEFHKWLHSSRAPKLPQLKFAVCGLGDKSYVQFCQTGKDFDARFEQLGATRLADPADSDVDFEENLSEWVQKVAAKMYP